MSDEHSTTVIEILLVEDCKSDAYLTQETLTETNIPHRLHHVKDGVEALDFLYQRQKHAQVPRPDLILLDLNMPRKNGHEVLAEIKIHATLSRIPVAVITTSSNEEDIARVYQQQAQFYLVKPVTLEQLAKILNDIG
ncbi:MAG: response regulator [Acaryochloris sp. RU_4_1]|nr:response regulator [Acaryochloris sp. RU_4_1]NJR56329.1 response regulator [Acaryochloris sp. CRU_2_0]